MPSFEQARATILEHVTVLGAESATVLGCVGRVLAADLTAPWDMPRWANSAMDGYAVHAADCPAPAGLRLTGFIPAGGGAPEPLARGTAAKILTGAPMPAGADAVVPVENAEEREGAVLCQGPVRAGANVRRCGEDFRAGEPLLRAGTVIGPAEVCVLASFSRVTIPVVRRARVAILSSGDELVEPGQPLAPGKIYDANGLGIAAAVSQVGGEPVLLGIARDDPASMRKLLAEGLLADALVTTAGVSAGDRDFTREVLQDLSVQQVFWKVDIKPGRPTAFAMHGPRPVFSLPGNPVSALLMFEQFVRPALLKMMGHAELLRPVARALLQDDYRKKPGRVDLVRVRLARREGTLLAWVAGNQETGILKTSLQADGIAVIPADRGPVAAGAPVEVQLLRAGMELRGDPA